MIKRDTLMSGVVAFLRLDDVDILSREDDKDPDLDPLETADDRAVEEVSFEIDFLIVLLPVLSIDVEGTLDGEENDEDGLTPLLIVLGVRTTGEEVTDLVSDELARTTGLPAGEGSELLWASGRDRRNSSFVELTQLIGFFTVTFFSCKLPVLFLLIAGAALEVPLP